MPSSCVPLTSVSTPSSPSCPPDLSLLQIISDEFEISVSELLNGRRLDAEQKLEQNDTVHMIMDLANVERKGKMKRLNQYFGGGVFCFLIVLFHMQFGILSWIFQNPVEKLVTDLLSIFGIIFVCVGFYYNTRNDMPTLKEVELLLKSKRRGKMRTAKEMLQNAKKYQDVKFKQYERAFKEIEKSLTEKEEVVFTATAASYARNELQMMWYVALAVTKERLLLAGEFRKGVILTNYSGEHFPISEIRSVEAVTSLIGSFIIIRTSQYELKIEEKTMEIAENISGELNHTLSSLQ